MAEKGIVREGSPGDVGRNGKGSMEGRVRDGEEDSSILAVPEEAVLSDAGNVLLSLSTQRGSLI